MRIDKIKQANKEYIKKFNKALKTEFEEIENIDFDVDEEFINYLTNFEIDDDRFYRDLENSKELKYAADKRTKEEFVISLFQNEQLEKFITYKLKDFYINPESTHGGTKKGSNSDADLTNGNIFIEVQSTSDVYKRLISIKKYKINHLRKKYGDKCYILSCKIYDNKIRYKIANVMDDIKDKGNKIGGYKDTVEILNYSEYTTIDNIIKFLEDVK